MISETLKVYFQVFNVVCVESESSQDVFFILFYIFLIRCTIFFSVNISLCCCSCVKFSNL